jgi:multiple sugar transport system permease protein
MNKFIESLRAYCFIAPNFFGFALFTALPVLGAVLMSFHSGTFSTRQNKGSWAVDARYVGLKNYKELLGFESIQSIGTLTYKKANQSKETLTLIRSDKSSGKRPLLTLFKNSHKPVTVECVSPQLAFFCGQSTIRELDPNKIADISPKTTTLYKASDPKFWFYLYNTLFFMIGIPIGMACSLFLAVLLNQKIKRRVLYRTLLFLPSVATGVAMFLVWRWIFNPNVGLINSFLDTLGLIGATARPDWLGDPMLVKAAIIAMGVFMAMGGTNMILFLAGLQGIDPTLYEAAEIDGAGSWAKFRHITWPQLRPTTFFILTTNLIGGFQMFDQAYVMTGGGPEGSTTTIVYYIYQEMFQFQRMGYAAAIAIVLFFFILLVTLLNWSLSRSSNSL